MRANSLHNMHTYITRVLGKTCFPKAGVSINVM